MNDAATTPRATRRPSSESAPLPLDRGLLIQMHELMVKARALEERLIQMYRQGHGFFWIGGPGGGAFNVSPGLLIKKGEGLDYDHLPPHSPQSATLLAMRDYPRVALPPLQHPA